MNNQNTAHTKTIAVEKLTGGYPGNTVFHNADISAKSGDIVVILGPNGSGKTTLLKTMLGLLKAFSGTTTLCNINTQLASPERRAKIISWVPQLFEPTWAYSVYDIVSQGRFIHAGPWKQFSKSDKQAIHEALSAMDLLEQTEMPINELSGGQARRVLIARALAQETPIIALDEPAAHLDPGRQMELMDILKILAHDGKTIIISLHDVNLAYRIATQAVLIAPDGNVLSGSPEIIFAPKNLEAVYDVEFFHGFDEYIGKFSLPVSRSKQNQTNNKERNHD